MARGVILDEHGREFEPEPAGFKPPQRERTTRPPQKPVEEKPSAQGGGVWVPDRWLWET